MYRPFKPYPAPSSPEDPLPTEMQDLAKDFRSSANELLELFDLTHPSTVKLKRLLHTVPDHTLPDLFTSILRASFEEKLEVLDAVELSDRFKVARPLLLRQIAVSGDVDRLREVKRVNLIFSAL